jgi:hypothetical protein
MKRLLAVLALSLPIVAAAQTTNNDDSCDIGTYPAATLLLPYFEVETSARGVDTFFTVTNVTALPQIAHVTLWTDWSFPVLDFNIFLTGYDVQAISLYDVINNGIIAPTNTSLTAGGTSSDTTPGSLSAANKGGTPNLDITSCGDHLLPGIIQAPLRAAIQSALVRGTYTAPGFTLNCGLTAVGSPASAHRTPTTAAGYVTIDVTSKCTPTLPTDPSYFVNEILFDNVLTGDYEILDKTVGSNYAGGNPLVHIRAVPEGGAAGATPVSNQPVTNLPYTFYGRFINGQKISGIPLTPHFDRRQPLASTFAARFIQGGPNAFSTDLQIWREGVAGPVTCTNASSNAALDAQEVVRFDEHENPNIYTVSFIPLVPQLRLTTPATSRTPTASSLFPVMNSPAGDTAGWLYLNLDSGKAEPTINTAAHPGFTTKRPSQNWVVVSMTAGGSNAGLFGVQFDAMSLGNGCSPRTPTSTAYEGTVSIGPAPNANP